MRNRLGLRLNWRLFKVKTHAPMTPNSYPGEELDLFAHARRWKAYWSAQVQPYLGANVLEVGAGIGTNTALLAGGAAGRWVCLEPDPVLAARIAAGAPDWGPARAIEVITGTVDDLPAAARFDTVLYIDVLEHIEADAAELAAVSEHLLPGGALIVLAPAHPGLFSNFDRAVGHYRRYTRASLAGAGPANATLVRLDYLDSAGVLASLANRAILGQRTPSARQIQLWDRVLVPISRRLDPLLGGRVGKSILAVWRIGDSAPLPPGMIGT